MSRSSDFIDLSLARKECQFILCSVTSHNAGLIMRTASNNKTLPSDQISACMTILRSRGANKQGAIERSAIMILMMTLCTPGLMITGFSDLVPETGKAEWSYHCLQRDATVTPYHQCHLSRHLDAGTRGVRVPFWCNTTQMIIPSDCRTFGKKILPPD